MNIGGWERLAQPSVESPKDVLPINQLILQDEHGNQRQVRVFPNMSVQSLRRALERAGIHETKTAFFDCSETCADRMLSLVSQAIPSMTFEKVADTEAGTHRVLGRTAFEFGIGYFQALAKIAFHHYLLYSQRHYKGSEDIFCGIRRFIRHGGDITQFFPESGDTFGSPLGEQLDGKQIALRDWCHVICVDEREDVSRVCMWLFAGPESMPSPVHVRLASDSKRILLPAAIYGCVYGYDPTRTDKYAGKIRFLTAQRVA